MKPLSSFTLCPINGLCVSDKENTFKPSEDSTFKPIKTSSPPINRNIFQDVNGREGSMPHSSCALDPQQGNGFRASPFEPLVHHRNLPRSGAISPLDSVEYRAWKSCDDDRDSRFEELTDADSEEAVIEENKDLVGLIVEARRLSDTWPISDKVVSPEESRSNWKERFLRSEVARTQTRMEMMALIEENRKLRVRNIGLEAALYEERRGRGHPTRAMNQAKLETDKTETNIPIQHNCCTADKEMLADTKPKVGSAQLVEQDRATLSEKPSSQFELSAGSETEDGRSPERPRAKEGTSDEQRAVQEARFIESNVESMDTELPKASPTQAFCTAQLKHEDTGLTCEDHRDRLDVSDENKCNQKQPSEIDVKDYFTVGDEGAATTNLKGGYVQLKDVANSESPANHLTPSRLFDETEINDEQPTDLSPTSISMDAAPTQNIIQIATVCSLDLDNNEDCFDKEVVANTSDDGSTPRKEEDGLLCTEDQIDHLTPSCGSGSSRENSSEPRPSSIPAGMAAAQNAIQMAVAPEANDENHCIGDMHVVAGKTESCGFFQQKDDGSRVASNNQHHLSRFPTRSDISDEQLAELSSSPMSADVTSPQKALIEAGSLKKERNISKSFSEDGVGDRLQHEREQSDHGFSPQKSDCCSFLSHVNSRRGGGVTLSSPDEESLCGLLVVDTSGDSTDTNPSLQSKDGDNRTDEVENYTPSPPARMTQSHQPQRDETVCGVEHDNCKATADTISPLQRRLTRRRAKELEKSSGMTGPPLATKKLKALNALPEVGPSGADDGADDSFPSIEERTVNLSPIEQNEEERENILEEHDCRNDVSTERISSGGENSAGVETRSIGITTRSSSSRSKSESEGKKKQGKRKRNGSTLLDSFQAPTLKNRRRRRRH